MTKKDYQKFASIIHTLIEDEGNHGCRDQGYDLITLARVTDELSYCLADDNPAFDRTLFDIACGWKSREELQ